MTHRPLWTAAAWLANFRERIRAGMRERGWTTVEVDERAGLSAGHTSKVLCGTRTPSLVTIELLSGALEIDPFADGRSCFARESRISESVSANVGQVRNVEEAS
jgi:transcriptional regulator with XRE-family HTH domain